jgi:hypothetical protein
MNDTTNDMNWFCLKRRRNMGDTEDGVHICAGKDIVSPNLL